MARVICTRDKEEGMARRVLQRERGDCANITGELTWQRAAPNALNAENGA